LRQRQALVASQHDVRVNCGMFQPGPGRFDDDIREWKRMPPVNFGSRSAAGRWNASVALLSLSFVLLFARPGQAQPGPLTFFKNYFITGDYAVAGVGLRGQGVNGLATGPIEIDGVPPDADIVAAFLYWQVVTTSADGPDSGSLPATFKGYPLRSAGGPFGKLLTIEGTAPCWASGGGTGSSGGSKLTYTYRADVLRYFDVDDRKDQNGNLIGTGKLIVNGLHDVAIPDSGSGGNATPIGLGASLVLVYRDTNPLTPLSAIVVYDGGYTLNNASPTMSQVIQGFYQSANGTGRLTHIVGSGQANKSETLVFNGAPIPGGSFGASAGPSWDNPTFSVTFDPGLTQLATGVSQSSDCLTWGAVIFKTEVKDTDGDGLLDVWETNPSLVDPNGQALPNLAAMGANPSIRDLFIEIGYMETLEATSYGGVSKPAHSHLPSHAALKLMGDAFANAPSGRINVHFDVGNAYPAGAADEYIIRGPGARGGDAISETITTQCARSATDPPWVCQFSEYPGTVGWKSGFRFLRDEVFSVTPTPPVTNPPTPLEDYCDVPGYTCERRFDRNRKDMFRYALFAHAIGLPKSEDPADPAGGFHVPRTNTGVGDFPGGDAMVTLGAFSDHDGLPLGTPFMQASTLMHELGHNMERRHGGEAFEPNCKPTYLSVMNYLYQLRGLLDDTGKPTLDFSWEAANPALDETTIYDGLFSPSSRPYRIGWYAPLVGSYLAGRGTAALRHCDGSELLKDGNGVPTEVPMVRIDARTAAGAIDWNANGTVEDSYQPGLDINFNGRINGSATDPRLLRGSDDWTNIRLNQLGGRRNTGGLLIDSAGGLYVGPLSLDAGRGDLGRGDLGRGDLGRGDLGRGDLGRGDLGRGDLGRGDLGRGDLGRGDLGRGDLGRGDLGGGDLFVGNPYQEGELDAETAGDLARTPPNEFTACVIGENCPPGPVTPLHAVRLGWTVPNVGGVSKYFLYRVAGDTLVPDTPSTPWTTVGEVISVLGQAAYSLVDASQLLNGELYTYFAVATYADGVESDPSNLVTITAVNDPPAAGGDSYSTAEDTTLTIEAPGVLTNDGDPDTTTSTLTAALVAGPEHGTVTLNPDGSFTYTPAANFYGADSFTYKATAAYGAGEPAVVDSNVATVTITVNAVNDAPLAANDAYATAEDTPLTVAAPGVLGNDADIDSAPAAVVVAGPANGTLALNADGSFTYTPAPNFYGADAFTYKASDGTLDSVPATVAITVTPVSDAPSISDIADRTIDSNTSTGSLPFTISDPDGLTGVLVSGSSSNAALVPNSNIVFAGTGAARTVTVTPAPNQYGSAAITVTVTDGSGLTAVETFLLSVTQVTYAFSNVQNAPPPASKSSFKAGSAVPMKWQFKRGSTVVDSALVAHTVTVRGPLPNGPVRTFTNTAPGNSSFQYDAATRTWQFNLQTKEPSGQSYPLGTYEVTITPTTPGYLPSPTFQIKLVK
jgi:VCBS repeat-containing protein